MAATTDAAQEPHEPELQRSLKPRHMTMIALGGIIGAGLFVGSSAVIGTVGPGAVVSYLAAGILGSFTDYTRTCSSPWRSSGCAGSSSARRPSG